MISWGDVYKVVVAMVPLYVALGLGYGSVRWWRMFKPDHCDAINRFNCYFILPFFTFQFTASVDPYHMNFRFLAGDVVAKAIAGLVLVLWAKLYTKGNLEWAITSFSLSSFNNTLVVGVPLLQAMYGALGQDIVVQSSVIQSLIWFPILLFLLQFRRTSWINRNNNPNNLEESTSSVNLDDSVEIRMTEDDNSNIEIASQNTDNTSSCLSIIRKFGRILNNSSHTSFKSTMKNVLIKVAQNPNCYACALGLICALVAKRWDFEMPSILEGSIFIMARGGSGVAMFTMGLFMALQDKIISCGPRLTLYAMILRFVAGPLTTTIGSLALGLRSNVLRIAIIQSALPQAVSAFVFAKEYELHAKVLSTAVIFGTVVSLPLLITYYIGLDVIH